MNKNIETVVHKVYEEIFNKGNHSLVSQCYTPDCVGIDPAYPGEMNIESLLRLLSGYREAFPDLRYTVEEIISDGDKAAVRWRVRGTQRAGIPGIPATGRSMEVGGISICHFKDGRICRVWQQWDNLGFFKQLGVNPMLISV